MLKEVMWDMLLGRSSSSNSSSPQVIKTEGAVAPTAVFAALAGGANSDVEAGWLVLQERLSNSGAGVVGELLKGCDKQ